MLFLRYFIISLGLFAISEFLWTNVSADEVVEIPRIGIYSDSNRESSVTTPGNVFIATAKQIAATSSVTITDFLDTQSIVQVNNNTGGSNQSPISIRGFGENAVANSLILIDGYRFTNPNLAAPNLNAILMPDIDSIEIIPGSEGTLYGDQAVGGVLKITTKKPENFTLKLKSGFGSYNQQLFGAYLADKLQHGLSYQMGGFFNQSNNYRDHNQEKLENFAGRLLYDYQQGSAFLRYQYYVNHFLYPGSLTAEQVTDDPRQAFLAKNNEVATNHIYEVGIKHFLNENWSLLADISHRKVQSNGFFYSDFNDHESINMLDVRAIGTSKRHILTIGSYVEQDAYSMENEILYRHAKQVQENIFLQDVITLLPKLELTVGGRAAFQQNALQAQREGSYYHVNDTVKVYELGLSYRPATDWRVYVRRDGNFRFPKTNEQQFTPLNNEPLNTQTGVSYESGVEWQQPGKSIKASAYHLVINNEIAFDPTPTELQPRGANRNLSRTVRDGVMLAAEFAINSYLDVSGQYTYVNPRFSDGPFKHNMIPGVANNNANLAIYLRLLESLKLYTGMVYSGRQYPTSDDANQADKLNGVWVNNIGLQYERQHLHFNLRLNNVFNKHYNQYTIFNSFTQNNAYYPAAGRNFLFTIGYEIG